MGGVVCGVEYDLSLIHIYAPIHYTLDGTEPTSTSPVYDGALKIKENADFSAIAIRPTGNSRVVSEKIDFSKSSMKPIVANQPVNKQYELSLIHI